MGSMPGTTICGLADGNNWAVRTIMNKYRDEFEKRVKPTFVAVRVTVGPRPGAEARIWPFGPSEMSYG